MKIKIKPIRSDFLQKVRQFGIDDQNQQVEKVIAQGGEPCRDVLRRANPGEELILASYCPFTKPGPYKEYGAIFVLENESTEPVEYNRLPLPMGNESSYLGESFVLRAYNGKEHIIDARVVSSEESIKVLEEFLSVTGVNFVLARYAAYGCYSLRIETDK